MLKVLCLHGAQQTAEMFEHSISRLTQSLADVATFFFLDAPFELPKRYETDAAVPLTWSDDSTSGSGGSDAAYARADEMVDSFVAANGVDVLLGFSQGALVCVRAALRRDRLPTLKGVILVGCPDPRQAMAGSALLTTATGPEGEGEGEGLLGSLPSLHVMGRKDAIVPCEESEALAAACGASAVAFVHQHAHSVPSVEAFLTAARQFTTLLLSDPLEAAALAEQRAEELEMVAGMYGDECVRRAGDPAGATVELPLFSEDAPAVLRRLRLQCRVPRLYPAVPLEALEVVGGPRRHCVAYERWRADLIVSTAECVRELGTGVAALVPTLLHAAATADEGQEGLLAALEGEGEGDGGAEAGEEAPRVSDWQREDEDADVRAAWIAEAEAAAAPLLSAARARMRAAEDDADSDGASLSHGSKQKGGTWTLTVGLIGKPSAGKSTFFNAITDPESESEAARVAAFPFTTIEPNVATGYGPLYCPCARLQGDGRAAFAECDAAYGHVTIEGRGRCRRHPVLVKDVAGLVRGAYQGKGKGNQFLNDLCDADVLVHVVDGAGATDAEGSACPPGTGSTLDDVDWVRAEVHNWIYDNIRAKWPTILRLPARLRSMFSGYRSSPTFIDALLGLLGIRDDTALAARLRAWGPRDLHLFIAVYVQARFPTVIALNKADLPTAPALAEELRAQHPGEVFVPMSARTECALLQLRRQGIVAYTSGDTGLARLSDAPTADQQRSLSEAESFFESSGLGDTGVARVLATALALCAATAVFPVSSFTAVPSLRHCLTFRAGSSVDTVYWALCHVGLLDGKLVRFEAVDATAPGGSAVEVLKKTDHVPFRQALARVLSNKRQME